ncbi:MAG: tetratricopeptide repeat protein [Bacteroidaceae bacterium]|nr:tetratricopeptide repeat protein [Bacteroidaceae bacterium]
MRKILLLTLIISISSVSVYSQSSDEVRYVSSEMADSSYISGDYATAAAIYEEILSTQGISQELYMNLGNAYFKMDQIAKAILNYERAYLIDPSNSDVQFNLELARSRIVDKEVSVNEFFITVWINRLSTSLNVNQWSILAISFIVLMALAIGIFVLSNKTALKKVSFGISIISLVISVLGMCFAARQKNNLTNNGTAIIMSPSVTVKSTPNENGTDLFIIHDGRKVKVLDSSMKEWVEIRLNDGNEGWIPVDALEII